MKALAPCWRCGSDAVVFTDDERRIALCGVCSVRLETVDQQIGKSMKFPGELHGPFIDVDKGHKVCTVCDQTLSNGELDQYCTGKGYYARSHTVPENLKTEPTWREKGFRPARGEKAKAWLFSYVYGQGHFWARLWDRAQVVPIKRRTPK